MSASTNLLCFPLLFCLVLVFHSSASCYILVLPTTAPGEIILRPVAFSAPHCWLTRNIYSIYSMQRGRAAQQLWSRYVVPDSDSSHPVVGIWVWEETPLWGPGTPCGNTATWQYGRIAVWQYGNMAWMCTLWKMIGESRSNKKKTKTDRQAHILSL